MLVGGKRVKMDHSSLDELISVVTGKPAQPTPLTGNELLEVVREQAEAPRDELLNACGYYTIKEGGKRSYRYTDFYQALIEAQGITLKPPPSTRAGRTLPYKLKAQKAGHALLGAAYTRNHGFKPGDKFKVEIKEGAIKLTPVRK